MVLIKQFVKKVLKKMGFFKDKNSWKIPSEKTLKKYQKSLSLISPQETLNQIRNQIIQQQKGAYLRFGDGDIYLMLGKSEMLNTANQKLASEMKAAMGLQIGVNQKGLPLHSDVFGFEPHMYLGMHLVTDYDAKKYLHTSYPYIKTFKIYSPVALHYVAVYAVDFCVSFLQFLKSTKPIFVGNENIQPTLVNKLFGNIHIKTASKNSYQDIDRVEQELIAALKGDQKTFRVIVVAMGCPGRVLQKRILKKGYNVYLFDFGSLLDALNDDDTRDWITLGGGVQKLKEILNQLT